MHKNKNLAKVTESILHIQLECFDRHLLVLRWMSKYLKGVSKAIKGNEANK